MRCRSALTSASFFLSLAYLPVRVASSDVLTSAGYTTCFDSPSVRVNVLNIEFNRATKKVTFDVSGTNEIPSQNITAEITATAYGRQVYQRSFSPCDADTYVEQLCPVPTGTFSAKGEQVIPDEYISQIPSIAFNIPDLDGQARLTIRNVNGSELACIESGVSNGRTMNTPVVSYIAAGVAGSAMVLSGLGAVAGVGAGGAPGAPTPSPNFGEVIGWFQTIATSGMLSVNYPSVYQSFTKNFAFSTGIIPWGRMQIAIDDFRRATGGNLTEDNYEYLRNVTVVAVANNNSTTSKLFRRAVRHAMLLGRDVTTTVNGQTATLGNATATASNGTQETKQMHYVRGVQAYVEQLMVPQANTFMTVLLYFAVAIASITVLILLGKAILEGVALCSKLPHSLESWRKRYWWRLAKAITSLIFILYGIWTLYCVYQFTNGDSWAAKALAGVTWGLFTAILAFFTWRIVSKARQYKKMDGDTNGLFENKETWIKYSLFYDSFKQGYWWIFIPAIVYMFARNAIIAGANGHGMVQAIGQMAIEALMLVLLVWSRPYQLRSGNVINIVIQAVRVLSVVCILVFVEELGISQTTQTITGMALIIVQSVLTGVLAILLAVNAIMACVKENPHRRQRKDQEKMKRDFDDFSPLDSRKSLLIETPQTSPYKASPFTELYGGRRNPYDPIPAGDISPPRQFGVHSNESRDRLIRGAAGFGGRDRSSSPQPRLPRIDIVGAR